MSTLLAAQDALNHLLDTMEIERDPLLRFQIIAQIETEARNRLRDFKRRSAYEAACEVTVKDLTALTGISHPTLKDMIDRYCDESGIDSPARRTKPADLTGYITVPRK